MGNGDSDATATFGTAGSFSLSEGGDDDYYDDSDEEAALEKEVTELQQPRTFIMHVSEFQKKCCPPVENTPIWCRCTFLCVIPIIFPFLMFIDNFRWISIVTPCFLFYVFCTKVWICCAGNRNATLDEGTVTSVHQNRSTTIPRAIPFATPTQQHPCCAENGNEKSDEGTVTLVRSQTTSGHVAG